MIEPNFNLLLWIIFITWGLKGVASIIVGAIGSKKEENFGVGEVIVGLITLLVCFIVCIF